ncbi:MAG TPA: hypothetical protein PKD59_02670 [Miltoncostaeaceae bacterium]|nr:hypothetical protein [Miltoncostaeaceae bacterium]
MASNRKLPRVKHADRPRPGETVLKQSGADLQNGWLARHGTLYATDDRLLFVPTVLDHALQAKRREIPLGDVTEIERFPRSPAEMPLGGKRPRMLIHTDACVYEFMVGDLDAWIDALERVYQRRSRETGEDYTPRITREGYVNLLMED